MKLLGFFKGQRDPDDLVEELGQRLVEFAPFGFAMLWARCVMVNGVPDVALFVQASESAQQATAVPLSAADAKELQGRFAELWRACQQREPRPWATSALTISGEGEMDVGYSYKPINPAEIGQIKQQWERRFLRDNYGPPPATPPKPAISQALERLLEAALSELQVRSAALKEMFALGKSSWSVDQAVCRVQFQMPDGKVFTAPFQAIGTLNTADGTWLWAWDNPSIAQPLRQDALAVRAYGEEHGHDLLTIRKFPCDEDLAWRLTALAAKLNNAQGAYRAPAGTALLFLTFGEVTLSAD